jgi:glycosyltransferase involved in cell wall biosynthesis
VKGIEYLVDAVAGLRDELPDLQLVIAGDGPGRRALEQRARKSGISDRVRFAGWVDDIENEMAEWQIAALPSLAEGLGIAALEAMAAGMPVIASDVGGLREIIQDGTTGFLIPPRNPASLAAKIAELARNPELRSRVGEAARAHVAKNFSIEREVSAIQSAYEKLLA